MKLATGKDLIGFYDCKFKQDRNKIKVLPHKTDNGSYDWEYSGE
jgi:hypothetical protein